MLNKQQMHDKILELVMDDRELLTGTIGDMGTSSFYPPHHMTMGQEREIA